MVYGLWSKLYGLKSKIYVLPSAIFSSLNLSKPTSLILFKLPIRSVRKINPKNLETKLYSFLHSLRLSNSVHSAQVTYPCAIAHAFISQFLFIGASLWQPKHLPFLYIPQLVQQSPQYAIKISCVFFSDISFTSK